MLSKTLIHLRVVDASQSAAFYEALLGATPAMRNANGAVFDLDSPPLLLTVEQAPRAKAVSSKEERFALVVLEPEHVGDAAIRLRRAGVRLRVEDQGIEALDPDGNKWRVRLVPFAPRRAVLATRVSGEEGKDREKH